MLINSKGILFLMTEYSLNVIDIMDNFEEICDQLIGEFLENFSYFEENNIKS